MGQIWSGKLDIVHPRDCYFIASSADVKLMIWFAVSKSNRTRGTDAWQGAIAKNSFRILAADTEIICRNIFG